jgi:hypothetical protein
MRLRPLALFFVVALSGPAGAVNPVADTSAAAVNVSVSPDLAGFYSAYRGLGVGLNVTADNLFWPGSELLLNAQLMTRHGQYSAFLFTSDPYESSLYGRVGARYVGSRAYGFFGLGPRSHRDDRQGIVVRRIEIEAGAGWYPLASRRLAVQPVVRLLHDAMREFEDFDPDAFARLDADSRQSLERAVGNASTGLSFGPEVILDLTDEPRHPRRGLLASFTARMYEGLDDDPFRYRSASATLHGFVPTLSPRHVLEARALLAVTREAGDRPVPFFALPTLDADLVGGYPRFRMVGRDLLALSLGARFPVLDVLNWVGLEGELVFHAANAYDDVFEQLEPSVSFERNLERVGDRARLRPAVTVGGHLMDLGRRLPILSGQIGFSPEGFELATLAFVVDLRAARPFVR